MVKKHKDTFLLSYFSVTKSTKSQQGGLAPSSLQTTVRRARVSRTSRAWQVRAANGKAKADIVFRSLQSQPHHACEHVTRDSRADSCTQACTPAEKRWAGVGEVSTLTEVTISLLQWEKVARFTATDEVLHVYCAKQILSRYVCTKTRTQTPIPCLGDADRVRFANRSIPARFAVA